MNTVCTKIKNQIGDLFSCSEFKNFIKISTPFLYADGDIISIFYKEIDQGFVLTDFGETLSILESSSPSGTISTRQEEIIQQICTNYNLKLNGEMIIGKFDKNEKLANKLINFSQSIVEISSLYVLNRGKNFRNIIDVVEDYIKELEIEYQRTQKYVGYMKREWHPHFFTVYQGNCTLTHILNAEKRGETKGIISTVNTQWQDLEAYRTENNFKFVSLIIDINDKNKNWTNEDEKFLRKTSNVEKWSNKENFRKIIMRK